MVEKPAGVASDAFKSAKWDELTEGRQFSQADAPTLTLLVQWYAVVQRCIDDMDEVGGQVAYENGAGDVKALPQLAVMKQASAEIRQLSKQLNITEGGEDAKTGRRGTVLALVSGNREKRKAGAEL